MHIPPLYAKILYRIIAKTAAYNGKARTVTEFSQFISRTKEVTGTLLLRLFGRKRTPAAYTIHIFIGEKTFNAFKVG